MTHNGEICPAHLFRNAGTLGGSRRPLRVVGTAFVEACHDTGEVFRQLFADEALIGASQFTPNLLQNRARRLRFHARPHLWLPPRGVPASFIHDCPLRRFEPDDFSHPVDSMHAACRPINLG